ncbi:MAG: biopolymer transporter ExbD [Gammaproteobacteria bacterium]|nr:biopolymer transporter ExbD [Gammaproteobacteria bacterium]MAY01681.1 biopolymer transporter ExbD [Gammaproteobacteria bacterium]|tara:strand:+ start:179342 stop:179767 length:426 start_codon:yes stop_codon:yes gene_type:complete
MKFARQSSEEVGVNLTPLIDVVFLLLIFFMVTTTFTRDSNLLINLPEASGDPLDVLPEQIEILVARNGAYSVNGRGLVNNQLGTLMNAIEEISAGDNSLPIIITADADTSYQSVVTVMDAVSQLGFSRLNIVTREEAGADE